MKQPSNSSHNHGQPVSDQDHQKHQSHQGHEDHQGHQGHEGHQGHHDHSHHHGDMIKDFKTRFWVSLLISIPVLIFSPMIQGFMGWEFSFPGMAYLVAGLSTFIFFYGGWPFLKGLKEELSSGGPGMMTLIAMAITVAWIYSTAVVLGLEGHDFYWELVTLIDIMLLGHWIEMKSVMGASKALEKLAELMPAVAHVIRNGQQADIPIQDLKLGDLAIIKPGEKIPADGQIKEGESELDESALTGESHPVNKTPGMKVIGGSINGDGSLTIQITSAGEDSYLRKVIRLVEEAQKSKSKTQAIADKAAGWLAYTAIGVGIITLLAWWFLSTMGLDFALERMVTVMIITCPHALGLAVPLVVAISTGISAKNGLLIRNRTAFENARKISTIVFDKTGTLTEGAFSVSRVQPLSAINKNELLAIAASVEQYSEHPIAKGIVRAAHDLKIPLRTTSAFKSEKGRGVVAEVEGHQIEIVSPGYLKANGIKVPENALNEEVATVVFVLIDKKLEGFISLKDKIRKESKDAVTRLKAKGIRVLMATGDNEKTAEAVSRELGLDGYYSQVLPHEKSEIIANLQKQGEFVAMTGDGVNDAPALAKADVGIAVGTGTDIAAETADIILTNSSPNDITQLIFFGRATYRKMVQNLIWATGYNVVAIPLAAGVLYYQGIMISPALGAVLMSLSTIVCAINAQLLRFNKSQT